MWATATQQTLQSQLEMHQLSEKPGLHLLHKPLGLAYAKLHMI